LFLINPDVYFQAEGMPGYRNENDQVPVVVSSVLGMCRSHVGAILGSVHPLPTLHGFPKDDLVIQCMAACILSCPIQTSLSIH